MRRGNPKPWIAIDRRAQRAFRTHVQFTLPPNGDLNYGSQWRVYQSPSFEIHGFTAPECFVSLEIAWQGFAPTWALIGQMVAGVGSPGSPGQFSALHSGIPFFPGKGGLSVPGTYQLNMLTTGDGADQHIMATEAWFELWTLGRKGPGAIDIDIQGFLVAGRSY